MKAYVYIHKKGETNEVFYIGIGVKENFKRASEIRRRNVLWLNVVKKYGFSVDVIASELTWEQACEIERDVIRHFGRRDLGTGSLVNMTDGGDGTINVIIKQSTKDKLREKNTNRVVHWGAKISAAKKGVRFNDEHKKKLSNAKIGNRPSQKAIDKLVAWSKMPRSLESKSKHAKRVLQYSLDGLLVKEYYGIKEAARQMGCSTASITQVFRGKAKTAKGFIWKLAA